MHFTFDCNTTPNVRELQHAVVA